MNSGDRRDHFGTIILVCTFSSPTRDHFGAIILACMFFCVGADHFRVFFSERSWFINQTENRRAKKSQEVNNSRYQCFQKRICHTAPLSWIDLLVSAPHGPLELTVDQQPCLYRPETSNCGLYGFKIINGNNGSFYGFLGKPIRMHSMFVHQHSILGTRMNPRGTRDATHLDPRWCFSPKHRDCAVHAVRLPQPRAPPTP